MRDVGSYHMFSCAPPTIESRVKCVYCKMLILQWRCSSTTIQTPVGGFHYCMQALFRRWQYNRFDILRKYIERKGNLRASYISLQYCAGVCRLPIWTNSRYPHNGSKNIVCSRTVLHQSAPPKSASTLIFWGVARLGLELYQFLQKLTHFSFTTTFLDKCPQASTSFTSFHGDLRAAGSCAGHVDCLDLGKWARQPTFIEH